MVFSFVGQFLADRFPCKPRVDAPGRTARRSHRLTALALALVAPLLAAAQDKDHETDALSVQGVAGEILDTAVEHCRRGEREQAMAMFTAIREQLDPPPGIARLVADLQATGCHGSFLAEIKGLRVQVGTGWDSNVSQGITARTLTIGTAGNTVDLELDDSYRPRSSSFVQAAVDYALPLPVAGLTLHGGLAHRQNPQASNFDLTTGSAALLREFRVGGETLRAQFEHSEVWLGRLHFLRTQGVGVQWLGSTTQWAWLAHALASRAQYLTQPSQDARQLEGGLLVERRISPAASVYGQFTWQVDNAAGQRAGGDRKGYQARTGALLLASGWQLRPQATYTTWTSQDLFAPGLIDLRRRNALTQFTLQAEKPLTQQLALVVDWTARSARDTVALYRYRAQSLTATVSYRF